MDQRLLDKAQKKLEELKKQSAGIMNLTSQLESLKLISDFKGKRIFIADENLKKPIDIAAVLDCREDVEDITECIFGIIEKRISAYEKELAKLITP